MSQENVDAVRAAWEAIEAGDLDGFLARVDPEVEFTSLVAEADAVSYRGHEGARQWWDSMRATFEDFGGEAIEVQDLGDRVLTHLRLTGTIRGTKLEQPMFQLVNVRDGLAISWTIFRTEAEALEAAGLSEQGPVPPESRQR